MIDRCLMRPRGLIDIVKYCRSYAVNLGHTQIQVEDIRKGVYSIENLLWYGFLGIVRGDGEQDFIYTVNYDMHVLNALVQRASEKGNLIYAFNPAFWAGLRIKPTDWAVRR
jgi:hypothetical protein